MATIADAPRPQVVATETPGEERAVTPAQTLAEETLRKLAERHSSHAEATHKTDDGPDVITKTAITKALAEPHGKSTTEPVPRRVFSAVTSVATEPFIRALEAPSTAPLPSRQGDADHASLVAISAPTPVVPAANLETPYDPFAMPTRIDNKSRSLANVVAMNALPKAGPSEPLSEAGRTQPRLSGPRELGPLRVGTAAPSMTGPPAADSAVVEAAWRAAHPSARKWAQKRAAKSPVSPRLGVVTLGLLLVAFAGYIALVFLPGRKPLTAAARDAMMSQAGIDEFAWRFGEIGYRLATVDAWLFAALGILVACYGVFDRSAENRRIGKVDIAFASSFLGLTLILAVLVLVASR